MERELGKAEFIRNVGDWRGDARLYRVDPPVSWGYDGESETDHVIVSGIDNEWGIETYIFAADSTGEVLGWGELDGSFRGAIDHEQALNGAGYSVCK